MGKLKFVPHKGTTRYKPLDSAELRVYNQSVEVPSEASLSRPSSLRASFETRLQNSMLPRLGLRVASFLQTLGTGPWGRGTLSHLNSGLSSQGKQLEKPGWLVGLFIADSTDDSGGAS